MGLLTPIQYQCCTFELATRTLAQPRGQTGSQRGEGFLTRQGWPPGFNRLASGENISHCVVHKIYLSYCYQYFYVLSNILECISEFKKGNKCDIIYISLANLVYKTYVFQ